MNTSSSEGPRDDVFEGRALVAAFPDREAAHDAVRRLHDEGFRRTWLGVTSAGTGPSGEASIGSGRTRVMPETETLGEKIGRYSAAIATSVASTTSYDGMAFPYRLHAASTAR